MSDFTVPSYRVRPERRGLGAGVRVPWRMLAITGAVLGAAAIGGAAVWGVTRAVSTSVPTIEADGRPVRVRPSDPGGLRVANQDERIFESQRRGAPGTAPAQPRLTPESERPDVAALRQAARAPAVPAPQPDAPPSRPPMHNPSLGNAPATGPAAAPTAAPAATSGAPAATPAAAPPAAPPAASQAPIPAITPPPLPANAPAARTGRFVVQLGAVTSEEAARGEWTRLQGRIPELAGRQPQISRVDRGDQPPLWRIRATGLPDAAGARALCDAAKAKGAPCAVIGG